LLLQNPSNVTVSMQYGRVSAQFLIELACGFSCFSKELFMGWGFWLQKVHCYICKQPGHLSCVEIVDASPTPVSCYQCGEVGHTGEVCICFTIAEISWHT